MWPSIAPWRFNHADPTPAEKTQISWLIQSAGQTIEQRQAVGDTLEFDVPVALAGQTIRVMPFRVSPTPRIAVVTMVEGRVETGDEVGEPNIKRVTLEREDTRFFARINNGPRFFVGSDVRFRDTRGLMNTSDRTGTSYRPEDYRDQHGFWADLSIQRRYARARASSNVSTRMIGRVLPSVCSVRRTYAGG